MFHLPHGEMGITLRYRGDVGDSGGLVTCHWEDRHELEPSVPRVVGP